MEQTIKEKQKFLYGLRHREITLGHILLKARRAGNKEKENQTNTWLKKIRKTIEKKEKELSSIA